MSSADKKSSACHNSKPAYVKQLNFGKRSQSNLQIHHPEEIEKNIVKKYALNFLSEYKQDNKSFVGDWLCKNEDFFELDNLVYPTSPVPSSSTIKRTPGSPIVGNLRKRPRWLLSSKENPSEKEISNLDVDHENKKNESLRSSCLSNSTEQSGSRVQSVQDNNREPLCLQSPSNGNKSPVLNNKARLRKLRQKRLSEGKSITSSVKLDNSSLKSEWGVKLKESDQILKNSDEKSNSKIEEREIIEEEGIEDETFYEEENITEEVIILEDKIEEENELKESLKESLRIKVCEKTQLSNFKSSAKESFFIATKNPKVFRDNESTFIEEDTESEETVSDFIEDVDTPDVVFVNNVKETPLILKKKITVPCQSPSKDSDETFFSGAGSCQSQYRQQLSQQISQISSSKIMVDSLSQVNNVINTETASPKNVGQSFDNILRTEEKKRRLKKGSLAAKLQNLVDTERSFMRMYQHKISQKTFQNDNIQFVDLCIQRCYTCYNRQFTECHLISDTHNLLKDVIDLQTELDLDSQTVNSKKSINKLITVMTVPEIVGGINAKRGKRLKVYPPWQILDRENITLSVTCYTVDENVNFEINDEKCSKSVKSKRIENFDCPCIREGRVVEDCSLRFNNKKPNVIKEIFNIS